jgi:exonuclease VII small subunit
MAKDKAKKAASDPEAKASGRKRKKAEDPAAKDETEAEAEPAGDPVADADPAEEAVEAKRRKGSDAKEAAEQAAEQAEDDPSDVPKPASGEGAPLSEKKKKGKAKPKSETHARVANDAPIVKVPSSKERLSELKSSLEDGMKELEEGRALVAAGEAELAELEAKMFEARNKISQQEAHNNRASRRLKQTAKSLQEQAVNTDMLKATLVTLVVRKAAKSKEPLLADVAATCGAILADWKAVVARDPGTADAPGEKEKEAEKKAETESRPGLASNADTTPIAPAKDTEMKEASNADVLTETPTERDTSGNNPSLSVQTIVPGKTAPHDPTRARVVGWLSGRVSLPAARALELEIFQAAATCGDEYKRCFKAAADLVARGNVPEGFVRKVVASWEP